MSKSQSLSLISLLVRDYDEALAFYVETLGFELVEDNPMDDHGSRWVVVRPPNGAGAGIVLAKASNDAQMAAVGNQAGGRVLLFLETDDIQRDFHLYQSAGVVFHQTPLKLPHGTVAIFQDLYGTRWDLIERPK